MSRFTPSPFKNILKVLRVHDGRTHALTKDEIATLARLAQKNDKPNTLDGAEMKRFLLIAVLFVGCDTPKEALAHQQKKQLDCMNVCKERGAAIWLECTEMVVSNGTGVSGLTCCCGGPVQ